MWMLCKSVYGAHAKFISCLCEKYASRLQPGSRRHLLMRKRSSDIGNQKMVISLQLYILWCLHRMWILDQEMGVEEALLLVCYVPQFSSNPNLLLKKTLNQTMPTTKENIFTIYQVLRKRRACEWGNGLMMMVCHTSWGAECHRRKRWVACHVSSIHNSL